ncbi:STAS domain-containing protein [Nocardia aobensis]|uniref:Anti-sigma factor antagonist n=1 Tax=Nocardia aobensis TaxID=257277 RepID=A0ABW6P632_9NOCA|nr:STAS domain-containing protein [Nocardia sp. MDA0666]PSR68234.1 anti-sigma factor antagonist [Nocardia sp. MDA0666]
MSGERVSPLLRVEQRTEGSAVVVTVAGEVDMNSAPELQSALDQALQGEPTAVVLDMTEVGFLGSAGLSVLLASSQSTATGSLRVVASPAVRRPIEVTSLDALLRLFPTVADALAAPEQTTPA